MGTAQKGLWDTGTQIPDPGISETLRSPPPLPLLFLRRSQALRSSTAPDEALATSWTWTVSSPAWEPRVGRRQPSWQPGPRGQRGAAGARRSPGAFCRLGSAVQHLSGMSAVGRYKCPQKIFILER